MIGVTSESARFTFELSLTDSVLSADMVAVRAGLTGVLGVNEDDGNPLQSSFILDEVCQLPECPRIVVATLSLPNNRSLTYALQVFEGNGSVSAFGLRNYTLGDAVISVGLESSFISGQLSEMAFRTFGPAELESSSEVGDGVSSVLDGISAEWTSIRIHCQRLLSEVYAQHSSGFLGRSFFFLTHNNQVEDSFPKHELSLKSPGGNIIKERVSEDGNTFSSNNCQYRDAVQFEGKRPCIIIDSPKRSELRLSYPRFEATTYLVDCPSRHLSREVETISHIMIDKVVCTDAIGCLSLNQNSTNVRTGFIESTHSITKKSSLSLCWSEFQFVAKQHDSYWLFDTIRISPRVRESRGGMLG